MVIQAFNWFDVTNSVFELVGSCMVWLDVRQIVIDKGMAGRHSAAVLFFTTWAFWNLFYYYNISQWCSLIMALPLAIGDLVWFGLMLKYGRKK